MLPYRVNARKQSACRSLVNQKHLGASVIIVLCKASAGLHRIAIYRKTVSVRTDDLTVELCTAEIHSVTVVSFVICRNHFNAFY